MAGSPPREPMLPRTWGDDEPSQTFSIGLDVEVLGLGVV
jgi:hypothetical protein